jgi:hypothetical protein
MRRDDQGQGNGGTVKPIFENIEQEHAATKLLDGGDDPINTFLTASNFADMNALNDIIRCKMQCDEFGLDDTMIRMKILGQVAIGGEQAHWFTRCVIGVIEDNAEKAKRGIVSGIRAMLFS